jgi:hypothetical protein
MGTSRTLIYYLVIVGLYIGGLLLLIVTQGLLDAAGLLSYLDGLIPFLILHLALLVAFFWFTWRTQPQAYREAQQIGLSAQGRVLAARRTRWRRRRGWGPWSYEHLLDLEVDRPGTTAQRAEVVMYLPRDAQPPAAGTLLPVKVHPRHPTVVILDMPEPDVSRG